MINWKVRLRNVNFWLAAIPDLLLVVLAMGALMGWHPALAGVQAEQLDLADAVFGLLAILGIVNDPTTAGFRDSEQALGYEMPKE